MAAKCEKADVPTEFANEEGIRGTSRPCEGRPQTVVNGWELSEKSIANPFKDLEKD